MGKWSKALLLLALLLAMPLGAQAQETCRLEAGSVTTQPGKTVTVPITLKGSPGVTNGAIWLEYDKKLLTLTAIQPGTALGDMVRCQTEKEKGGDTLGYVLFAVDTAISGDAALFTATFQVTEEATGIATVTPQAEYLRSNAQNFSQFQTVSVTAVSGTVGVQTLGQRTKGDVNGDGRINVLDSAMVYDHLNGTRQLDELQMYAADVDENGTVDRTDAIRIYRLVNNRIAAFKEATEGE